MENQERITFGELVHLSIVRVDRLYIRNGKDYKEIKKVKLSDYIDYSDYTVECISPYQESEVNYITDTATVQCGIRVYIFKD